MSLAVNPALLPAGGWATVPLTGPTSGVASGGGTIPLVGPTHGPAAGGQGTNPATGPSGPSFADVLKKAAGPESLRFSKHALERVQRRGIDLDPTTLGRLHEGVGRAAGKGSRDSIVLVDDTAFVVSVPNRTVITAVGSEHMRDHVFTNIDSAVIA
jgi:flagellar operon protein